MNTENTITLSSSVTVHSRHRIDVDLCLSNMNQVQSYYISSHAIYMHGFFGNPFSITGPSSVPCHYHSTMYNPGNILTLHPGENLKHTLNLNTACNFHFANSGMYTILFNRTMILRTSLVLDDEVKHINLYANSTFTLPDFPSEQEYECVGNLEDGDIEGS